MARSGSVTTHKKIKGVFEKVPGSGVWWIRFAGSTGRLRREVAGTKSAAKQLYQMRKATVLQGQKLPHTLKARPVTFRELSKVTLEYSVVHKKSASDDQERMKVLVDWFGDTPAESLRPQDIQKRLLAEAKEREWKPATVNRYRALMSLLYRLAVDNGTVPDNPVRKVRRRREDSGVIRYLSAEEEKRLREVIEPTNPQRWAVVQLALNTGMRAGEQWGLRWKDVSLEPQHRQLALYKTKNGSTRHVPLNAYALEALATLEAPGKPNARVVPQQSYRGWFEIALRAAKVEDFHWHCLRHTFASRLVMAGVDLRTVAELLGHKSLQMTMRYAHLAPEHKAAAVDKLVARRTGTKSDTGATSADALPSATMEQVVEVAVS